MVHSHLHLTAMSPGHATVHFIQVGFGHIGSASAAAAAQIR